MKQEVKVNLSAFKLILCGISMSISMSYFEEVGQKTKQFFITMSDSSCFPFPFSQVVFVHFYLFLCYHLSVSSLSFFFLRHTLIQENGVSASGGKEVLQHSEEGNGSASDITAGRHHGENL